MDGSESIPAICLEREQKRELLLELEWGGQGDRSAACGSRAGREGTGLHFLNFGTGGSLGCHHWSGPLCFTNLNCLPSGVQVRPLARLVSGSARRSQQGSDGQRVELSLGLVFAKLVLHKCSQYAGNGRASDQIFALKEMCLFVTPSNLNRQLPGAACLPLLQSGKTAERGRRCLRWPDGQGRWDLKQLMLIAKKNRRKLWA